MVFQSLASTPNKALQATPKSDASELGRQAAQELLVHFSFCCAR